MFRLKTCFGRLNRNKGIHPYLTHKYRQKASQTKQYATFSIQKTLITPKQHFFPPICQLSDLELTKYV
ncbi:hypothetical protein Barb4_00510 [Bacteroidales bacterium Barb4]|nr:hypothetical protein Barb4_00510 [Bacteroidales bacterium Barb4]